jgi:hypothetical protein
MLTVPRYQKRSSFATLQPFCLSLVACLLFLLFCGYEQAWASAAEGDLLTAPSSFPAQLQAEDPGHLFLLPAAASPVKLISHTADVTIQVEADQLLLTVKATYRLHNTSKQSTAATLQVIPARSQVPRALPQAISLTLDGQPLALQQTGEAQQTTQVTIPADSRRLLVLNYRIPLAAGDLATFQYPMSNLSGWSSPPESWRMTLNLPGEASGLLPAQSWTVTQPAGWTYNGSRVQWLGEGQPPAQLTLQFIHPRLWRELRETKQLLAAEPRLDRFLYLGDLYTRLYRSTQPNEENHRRFYAETLAAYADGIHYGQQMNLPAADLAPLHRALTALYRGRSIQSDGALDFAYVDLMVAEAQKALAAFPPVDEGREDVAKWLAEGLKLQLRRSQQADDWTSAFNILDQMEDLPAALVDPAWLAAEREVVQMQQALTLFDQGHQEAAIALTGPEMHDESLLPRPEHRVLLDHWQVALTLQPDAVTMEAIAHPAPGREALAHQAFQQFAQSWQEVAGAAVKSEIQDDGAMVIRLDSLPLNQRLALAQATPAIVDWLLLRNLLVNLEPVVTTRNHLIWQEVEMVQQFNLRSVSEQWQGMAALLERQAGTDLAMAATTSTSVETVQEELREQLRRLHHRQEARNWQNLVQSTTIRVEAKASATAAAPARTWIVQMTDPPQTLNFHSQILNPLRVVMAVIALFILIFALAGVLWLLL